MISEALFFHLKRFIYETEFTDNNLHYPLTLAVSAQFITSMSLTAIGITLVVRGCQGRGVLKTTPFHQSYANQAFQARSLIDHIEQYPNVPIEIHLKDYPSFEADVVYHLDQ